MKKIFITLLCAGVLVSCGTKNQETQLDATQSWDVVTITEHYTDTQNLSGTLSEDSIDNSVDSGLVIPVETEIQENVLDI